LTPRPMLVTAAAGNVGREVVAELVRRGVPVRAAERDLARASAVAASGVERVRLDFTDRATWGPAVAGCDAMFLLRPPAISDMRATLVPFVDRARDEGVRHVVFLSVAGAGSNKLVPHHAVEAHLAASREPHTILRPGFFAQNLQDAYLRDITEDDRLHLPAGEGRVAFVDVRDVAEVAALALVDPAAHAAKAYTLTGPEAIDFRAVAEILSDALGRTIRYVPASVLGYVHHLRRRRGLAWQHALVQTILHVGLRWGQAQTVDPTLARLLGRPGRTLCTYVHDHAHLFGRARSRAASDA
jgi:uncharacterized protein YbjT (DUF2867 family)